MSTTMGLLDSGKVAERKEKDVKIISQFVGVFCQENHAAPKRTFEYRHLASDRYLKGVMLCDDCHDLLTHGLTKLLLCPYDPKPMCKKCPAHCYRPGYREQIKKVMRFSGMHLIKRGRLDLLLHYFF